MRYLVGYAVEMLGKGYADVVIVDLAENGRAYAHFFARSPLRGSTPSEFMMAFRDVGDMTLRLPLQIHRRFRRKALLRREAIAAAALLVAWNKNLALLPVLREYESLKAKRAVRGLQPRDDVIDAASKDVEVMIRDPFKWAHRGLTEFRDAPKDHTGQDTPQRLHLDGVAHPDHDTVRKPDLDHMLVAARCQSDKASVLDLVRDGDWHKRVSCGAIRNRFRKQLTPPGEQLARRDAMIACNLRRCTAGLR